MPIFVIIVHFLFATVRFLFSVVSRNRTAMAVLILMILAENTRRVNGNNSKSVNFTTHYPGIPDIGCRGAGNDG